MTDFFNIPASISAIGGLALLTACSAGTPSSDAASDIGGRYERAVQCAGNFITTGKLYQAAEMYDDDTNPSFADFDREGIEQNRQMAERFTAIAQDLGASPEVGKSPEEVAAEIAAADQAIGARIPPPEEFIAFIMELDADVLECIDQEEALSRS